MTRKPSTAGRRIWKRPDPPDATRVASLFGVKLWWSGTTGRQISVRLRGRSFGPAPSLGFAGSPTTGPDTGGSTPTPDRDIASAARYTAAVAAGLGVDRFATMGHSSGGAYALASGALLPGRVVAVVSISTMAPYTAEGLDWFAGFGMSSLANGSGVHVMTFQTDSAAHNWLNDVIAIGEGSIDPDRGVLAMRYYACIVDYLPSLDPPPAQ